MLLKNDALIALDETISNYIISENEYNEAISNHDFATDEADKVQLALDKEINFLYRKLDSKRDFSKEYQNEAIAINSDEKQEGHISGVEEISIMGNMIEKYEVAGYQEVII